MAQQKLKSLTLHSNKILILLKEGENVCLAKQDLNTLKTSELTILGNKTDESSEVFNETKIRRGVNRAFEKERYQLMK